MHQCIPLINRPLKHRCVYIHKQDLLASQRAVPIKPRVPEGGALLSSSRPGDVTTTWGCLVRNTHTAQEFAWPLDSLTPQQLQQPYKFCVIEHAQFGGLLKTFDLGGEYKQVFSLPIHDTMHYQSCDFIFIFWIGNTTDSKVIRLERFSENSLTIGRLTWKSVEVIMEAGRLVNRITSACLHGWSLSYLATK